MDDYNTKLPGDAAIHRTQYAPPAPLPSFAPPAPMAAPAAPAQAQEGVLPKLLKDAVATKGGPLNDIELDSLGEYIKTNYVAPELTGGKISEWEQKTHLAAFDQDFAKFKENYLKENVPADGAEVPSEYGIGRGFRQAVPDQLAAIAGGVAKSVAVGVPATLDYIARDTISKFTGGYEAAKQLARVVTGQATLAEGRDATQRVEKSHLGDETILGELASYLGKGIDSAVDYATSNETLQARKNIQLALADPDKHVGDWFKAMVTNPSGAGQQIAEVVGGFLGPAMALKAMSAKKLIMEASPWAKKAIGAIAIGGPQTVVGVREWENQIREVALEDLRKDPKLDAAAKALEDNGATPEQVSDAVRNLAVGRGLVVEAATQAVGNILTEVIPVLGGMEARFALGAAKDSAEGLIKRTVKGSARETPQELLATGIQTPGENLATNQATGGNKPLTEGLAQAEFQTAFITPFVGGGLGALEGGRKGKPLKSQPPSGTPTPTNTTDQNNSSAATQTENVPAPVISEFSPTPLEGFDKKSPKIIEAIKQDNKLRKVAKEQDTIEGIVNAAELAASVNAAQQGVSWGALNLEQQSELVSAAAEELNRVRGKNKFDGLGEAMLAWNAARQPNPAAVAPAPAPAESTPEQVRAAIAEVGGTQAPAAAPAAPAPVQAATPAPASTTGLGELGGAGAAIADNFYNGAFAALSSKGASTFKTEPFWKDLEAAYKAGQITDAAKAKDFIQNWKPAPAPAPAPVQAPAPAPVAPKTNASTQTPEQKRSQYIQAYLRALLNTGPSTGAEEEAIRADSNFNLAKQKLSAGLIQTPGQLDEFLKEQSKPAPKASPATSENLPLGVALNLKGVKKEVTQTKQLARKMIEELKKKGVTEDEAKKLTFAQAKESLRNLESLRPSQEVQQQRAKTTVTANAPTPAPAKTGPKPLSLKKAAKTEPTQEAPKPEVKSEPKPEEPKPKPPEKDELISLPKKRTEGVSFRAAAKSDDPLLNELAARISRKLLASGTTVGRLNFMSLDAAIARYNTELEEETKPPKTEAPAQKATGAAKNLNQQSQQNQPPNQKQVNSRSDPVDVETRVASILSDTAVTESTEQDIVLAIVNEDTAELGKILRQLQKDKDVDLKQAFALSSMIVPKEKTATTLEPVETPDELYSPESLSERSDVIAQLNTVANSRYGAQIQVIPKLKNWLRGFLSGKYNEEDLINRINDLRAQLEARKQDKQLRQLVNGKARGADWFEERLSRALRNGEVPRSTVEFMRWLIRKNPALVQDLAISIKQLNTNTGGGLRGNYNPITRTIALATDANVHTHTGVHEILHHTERMMPRDIREGIFKSYTKDIALGIKSAESEEVKAYLNKALEMALTEDISEESRKELTKLFRAAMATPEGAAKSLYQFYNPSEYWAVNGPIILQGRMEANTWVKQAKQWLKEFIEKIKEFFGAANQSSVIKGLDSILKSDGKFLAGKQIAGDSRSFSDLGVETNKDTLKAKLKESLKGNAIQQSATRTWEVLAQRVFAFEQELARVLNAGGKVTPETDPVLAAVRFNGLKNDRLSLDESEVSASVYNWFTENHALYGDDRKDAVHNVNKFLHNTHVLERNHILWLQKVKLGAGQAYARETILENVSTGKVSPEEGRSQLENLVNKYALEKESAYGARVLQDYDKLISTLVELKQQGIDQKSMAGLNALLDRVRERGLARNLQAQFVDPEDPWIKFYDFKWYVPLKGTVDADANSAIADLDVEGVAGRKALATINKQIQAMGGRKSIADSPLEQLLVDLAVAGRRTAETDLIGSLYQFILDNKQHFPGVEISVYEGRSKEGYKQIGGKKKKSKKTGQAIEHYRKLPAPGDGFIYHQGDVHYVVKLPHSSLMLRGVLQMGNEAALNYLDLVVGKGTNILSKLYTTINPLWQTFVALPRDLTYMPVMMAINEKSNPIEGTFLMGKYIANLFGNGFGPIQETVGKLLGGIGLTPPFDAVQYAKDNPTSYIAWLRRYEENGGSTNFVAGFNKSTLGSKLTSTYNNAEGIWVINKPWKGLEKVTTSYASILENIGRVAAFKTLVESGQSEREAAAKVKGYLNYDQAGTHSRKINSYLQFFKVGMTGADAMRKAFTKQNGEFDTKKFGSYLLYFMVLGASKYYLDRELFGVDENGEHNIKKIKLDTLTQKAVFKMGDKTYGFNIGLGLPQLLLAPGTLMAAAMAGDATPGEAGRAMYETFGRNAPVRPAGLPKDWGLADLALSWTTGSLVPAPLVGIQAIAFNRDAFGRSIHTEFKKENEFKSDSAKPTTAQVWTELATWLREHNLGDHYPEDLKYLTRTYGGQLVATYQKATSDAEADQAAGTPVDTIGRVTGYRVIDEQFYLRNETYDTLDRLSNVEKRLNAIKNKAAREGTDEGVAERRFLATTPGAAPQLAAYTALDKAIKAYNKEVKAIRANKLSGQEWKNAARKKADSRLREAYLKAKAVLPG